MIMTERDIEILKFINDFGFCEITHIEKNFQIKKPRSYQIMKCLIKAGLVMHQKMLQNQHGIFYVTRKGANFTDLYPLKNIPLSNYHHQLLVIDVYLKLMQQYPDAQWISQRYLTREKYQEKMLRDRGHIADGMLVLSNERKIAIEVELTLKGKDRLNQIFKEYVTQF